MRATAFALAFLLCGLCRGAADVSAKELAQKSFKSVALLVMADANGHPLRLGSGFFVADDVLATSLHVVDGTHSGFVKLVGRDSKYQIDGLVAQDQERDLALVAVKGTGAPVLPLRTEGTPDVGDNVFSIGNPRGLEGTFAAGIVSAVRKVGSDHLLQVTAPISPGSSGGPVIDTSGNVVGVATAGIKDGQNLNFAVPASYLAKLLGQMKAPARLVGKTLTSDKKSIIRGFEADTVGGVDIGDFLWESRYNLQNRGGEFIVSIRNHRNEPIRNVEGLVLFYNDTGQVLDAGIVKCPQTVWPKLATRVRSRVDPSVQTLVESARSQAQFNAAMQATKRRAENLRTRLEPVEKAIAEIEQQLASSQGDRTGLLRELRRLQSEKEQIKNVAMTESLSGDPSSQDHVGFRVLSFEPAGQ